MVRPASGEIFLFEGFRFDRAEGCLLRENGSNVTEPVALGSRAAALLALLVERQGKLVTKDEIFAAVWPGTAVEEANLTVQMSALRRILDQDRGQGSCIQTVPSRGYRFVPLVTRATPSDQMDAGLPFANGAARPMAEGGETAKFGGVEQVRRQLTTALRPDRDRLRQATISIVGGVLCLVAVGAAALSWRSLSPWQTQAAQSAPRLSIVVLPFENLSNDPGQQYFADGVTEEVTADLSRIAHMFVISRSTAFTYKNRPVDAKQIGRELRVRYLLEGSVRRSGNQVRVNAQLIDAETDAHLWAERLDGDTTDLFALQNEITSRIANALGVELIAAEAARPAEHPDALDYILRGRAVLSKPRTPDTYSEAINFFERALRVDPQSAEAQSRLAIELATRVFNEMSDSRAADIARAETLAAQALAAAPRSPLARFAKAQVLRAQRRCYEAIPEYETVLASDRNAVDALVAIAQCKVFTGSTGEAIPLVQRAISLSPRAPVIFWWYFEIGRAHLLQSHTDEAILWLEKARSANPAHPPTRIMLASAYGLNGKTERAAAELAEAKRLSRDDRFSSIAHVKAVVSPSISALFEATVLAGLRKAGMPEE